MAQRHPHFVAHQSLVFLLNLVAPEILKEKPYGRAVDWWAFGVLLYEMLLGQSPFRGDDEDQIFNSILKDEVVYPSTLTKDSISLLNRLLCKNPDNRIGSGMDDAVDIKAHSYFKGVNWDDVLNTRIKPPYFPKVVCIFNFLEEQHGHFEFRSRVYKGAASVDAM